MPTTHSQFPTRRGISNDRIDSGRISIVGNTIPGMLGDTVTHNFVETYGSAGGASDTPYAY
jgi:hypothetical protein